MLTVLTTGVRSRCIQWSPGTRCSSSENERSFLAVSWNRSWETEMKKESYRQPVRKLFPVGAKSQSSFFLCSKLYQTSHLLLHLWCFLLQDCSLPRSSPFQSSPKLRPSVLPPPASVAVPTALRRKAFIVNATYVCLHSLFGLLFDQFKNLCILHQ